MFAVSAEPILSGATGLIRVCRLAEGGMARVDLAIKRSGTFRRMYAVKRLHPHLASDPEFRQMFLDEARIAGLIRHPNVVGVLDVGEDELGPFLVMDYVDGLPLSNLLGRARQGAAPIPVQIAVRIALDIARGLHAAHQLRIDAETVGVVHRDLSPQNVMVGFDGQARLTDFGIAKALGYGAKTATGVVKGKTSYLSPEQIRSEVPDRRSDLFSLGIVLFEMLSGARLYKRGDGSSDMHAIVEEPVPDIGELRPDVPDELVRLSFELLAKSREARPADADQVVRQLESILAALIAEETPHSVADYVEEVAAEVKREQTRVLTAAIAEVEAGQAAPVPHLPIEVEATRLVASAPPRWSWRPWLTVLVLGCVVLGVALFASRGAPTVEAPLVAPHEPPAPAPSISTPPPPPLSSPQEVAVDGDRPTETPKKATKARLRRPKPRRPLDPVTAEPAPLPDWVEFEK